MTNRVPQTLIGAIAIALLCGMLFTLPQLDGLRNLTIDILTWARWRLLGNLFDPSKSPTAVIAIDEETYNSDPFVGTPTLTWTGELGKVVLAVIDGGAKVVGFDIVFPNSIEQSLMPFGQETIGQRLRGFDRDYLRALASAARQNKLVLGRVQRQGRPIVPSDAQRIAVGQHRNIRPLNLYTDADGVVRRVPLRMAVDGDLTASMSAELAARALGTKTASRQNSSKDYEVPQSTPDVLTLNFEGGNNDIPTYSLADLRECLQKGNAEYFRRHFEGRVVLLGVVLDLEDRSLTSKRLATGTKGATEERCARPRASNSLGIARPSIPSVYVHATAVNNLLRVNGLREMARLSQWGLTTMVSVLASVVGLAFSPLIAALALSSALIVWTTIAIWAFAHALVLPLLPAATASVLTLSLVVALRFGVADREKRFLRRSFSFYLAPVLIDKMLASETPPRLGGETRLVTLYRSDLAGFSSMSQKLPADELVPLMNEYLTAMTDLISLHGGFVDKYIGDAIDGIFNAPVSDPDHALNAVKAALAGQARLSALNAAGSPVLRGYRLRQRIGLHTGDALVGNIGSKQRFNYTAMGDTANLASRLEGANKFYATSIIASEATVRLSGNAIFWRELDYVQVVGRQGPVAIYEPLGEVGTITAEQMEYCAAYSEGLWCWRAGDFGRAADAFGRFADVDSTAAAFRGRALKLLAAPRPERWNPVNVLENK